MKNIFRLLLVLLVLTNLVACNKETETTGKEVMLNMIANKTWYLDYSITGTTTQNFVGQSTYYITFLNDGTTKDSDGLNGTYTISKNGDLFNLVVNAKTINGNTLNYNHKVESVGTVKMVLSFIASGQSNKTTLYFTSK